MWFCTVYYDAHVVRIARNSLITRRQFSNLYWRFYFYDLAINDAYVSIRFCVDFGINFNVITWQIICAVRSWTTCFIVVDAVAGLFDWWKMLEKFQQELLYILICNRIIGIILSWQLCLLDVVCPSHGNLDLL